MGGGGPVDSDFARLVYHLCEGNPGALTAISEMIKYDEMRAAEALGHLAGFKITGPLIWLCYKDICNFDVKHLFEKTTLPDMQIATDLAALPYSGYKRPKHK